MAARISSRATRKTAVTATGRRGSFHCRAQVVPSYATQPVSSMSRSLLSACEIRARSFYSLQPKVLLRMCLSRTLLSASSRWLSHKLQLVGGTKSLSLRRLSASSRWLCHKLQLVGGTKSSSLRRINNTGDGTHTCWA